MIILMLSLSNCFGNFGFYEIAKIRVCGVIRAIFGVLICFPLGLFFSVNM